MLSSLHWDSVGAGTQLTYLAQPRALSRRLQRSHSVEKTHVSHEEGCTDVRLRREESQIQVALGLSSRRSPCWFTEQFQYVFR